MKKAKLVKVKEKKEVVSEPETYKVKDMVKIIIIMILVLGAFYAITLLVVKNKENKTEINSVIDNEMIILSNLLNQPEDSYYVLAVKENVHNGYKRMNYSNIYIQYINDYKTNDNALAFYKIDLDDAINKNFLSDKTNVTNNINELKLSDEVLFKIENKEIKEYYVGSSKIIDALTKLKEN